MRQIKLVTTFVNMPAAWFTFVPSYSNSFIQIKVTASIDCVDGFWDITVKHMTFPGYFGLNFDPINKAYLQELIDQSVMDEYINQKQDLDATIMW